MFLRVTKKTEDRTVANRVIVSSQQAQYWLVLLHHLPVITEHPIHYQYNILSLMPRLLLIFLLLKVTAGYKNPYCHGICNHGQLKVSNMIKTVPKCKNPTTILRTSCLLPDSRSFFSLSALPSTFDGQQSLKLLAFQEDLVALRKRLSIEFKKPAFVVFTNKAKEAIISAMPQSSEEIESLSYSGNKISKYAYSEILKITSKFLEVDLQSDDRIPQSVDIITQHSGASEEKILMSPAGLNLDQNGGSDDSNESDILLSSLSAEQQRAAERALSGHNIFITGSAGTGKSFLLKYIVQEARKRYSDQPDSVVITAPTGVAAINVGGATINSFAGYGLGK